MLLQRLAALVYDDRLFERHVAFFQSVDDVFELLHGGFEGQRGDGGQIGHVFSHSAASRIGTGGNHFSTGFRAAPVSSRRRRGARYGAPAKRSVSPRRALIARSRRVAMNRSSEARDSDSVGSISIAPCTTSGKYMVIG